ncbi:hypothetical protein J5N97_009861 [Dioscorea zingiberensis]|uniref:Uncharacterized protein n=1 Tax=Dioscorea zingiberensis TaxID=325984 RepID=A0A9D5CXN3_9LILI|nr:hypothetical protein J5N97_009861 [Dioscorea zingiberensis]
MWASSDPREGTKGNTTCEEDLAGQLAERNGEPDPSQRVPGKKAGGRKSGTGTREPPLCFQRSSSHRPSLMST